LLAQASVTGQAKRGSKFLPSLGIYKGAAASALVPNGVDESAMRESGGETIYVLCVALEVDTGLSGHLRDGINVFLILCYQDGINRRFHGN